jgi:hypothetical protein
MDRASASRGARPRVRGWFAVLAVLLCGSFAATLPAQGASSSTVIGASVASATQVDVTGCQANVPGRTDFGTILPGSASVTTSDCSILFGSSNSSSSLRVRQHDRTGSAMYAPSVGTATASWGTAGLTNIANATWSTTFNGVFADDG